MPTFTISTLNNMYKQIYGPTMQAFFDQETPEQRKSRLRRAKNKKKIKDWLNK